MYFTMNTYFPEPIAMGKHLYKEVLLLLKFSSGKSKCAWVSNITQYSKAPLFNYEYLGTLYS